MGQFGDLVREIRKTEKQPAFARRVGIDQSVLSRVERGESVPSVETLLAFVVAFPRRQRALLAALTADIAEKEVGDGALDAANSSLAVAG